ncbi:DUF4429 domain-containing protein [Listeria booriae]|uniref:DUF4429 domain-containing protein n=1 Tax=Listeria booriae TaxID=1552123 RepID=UPI00162A7DFC|nr:DUF4429 domain-containing protein [Listeria booriae]MBC1210533.1 DUF4429 domain-containing protein [Listeria booriae]MBC1228195.1 DUF4429 domain-containing protein [Listeria booriae]
MEIIIKNPNKVTLSLINDSINISRKGIMNFANHGLKGDKTIYIRNISGIQLKKPGMTNGYIQFTLSGGTESKGGVFSATQDENTVMFSKKYYNDVVEFKTLIEQKINTESTTQSSTSNLDEIKKLKELLDIEAITQEEFDLKKAELMK